MCRTLGRIVLWAWLCGCATRDPAPIAKPVVTDPLDELVRGSFDGVRRDAPVAGMQVAIARDGTIIFERGYGLADVENSVPVTSASIFIYASITKQMTATAILHLVETGKVALEDPIGRFVPDLPASTQPITVRQLLTHTSGIPDFPKAPGFDPRRDLAPREVVRLVAELPLDFSPGTKWDYSNTNYTLLGLVIEAVTKTSFEDYVTVHLLAPAGMTSTSRCLDGPLVAHRAHGYVVERGRIGNAPYRSGVLRFSTGGLCGTAGDLVRWRLALDSGKLISKKSFDAMNTVHLPPDSDPYGFGIFVDDVLGHRDLYHQGSTFGFASVLHDLVDDRLVIAVLTNTQGVAADVVGHEVTRSLLGHPIADLPVTPSDRNAIAGHGYLLPDGPMVRISNGRDHLILEGDPTMKAMARDFPIGLRHQGNLRFNLPGAPTVEYSFAVEEGKVIRAERRQDARATQLTITP